MSLQNKIYSSILRLRPEPIKDRGAGSAYQAVPSECLNRAPGLQESYHKSPPFQHPSVNFQAARLADLCPLTARFRLGLPVLSTVQRTTYRAAGTYLVQRRTVIGRENGENGTYARPFRSETKGDSVGMNSLSGSSFL